MTRQGHINLLRLTAPESRTCDPLVVPWSSCLLNPQSIVLGTHDRNQCLVGMYEYFPSHIYLVALYKFLKGEGLEDSRHGQCGSAPIASKEGVIHLETSQGLRQIWKLLARTLHAHSHTIYYTIIYNHKYNIYIILYNTLYIVLYIIFHNYIKTIDDPNIK